MGRRAERAILRKNLNMTLKELTRQDFGHESSNCVTIVTTAETEEQRAAVTTLETRLDAEEAELTASEKWDEAQQRIQARLTTETLTEQAPRKQTPSSDGDADPEVRERGEIVLTREFIGDMLQSRERRVGFRVSVAAPQRGRS